MTNRDDVLSKRIGLLGGTFNPIHKAHLHVAHAVSQRLSLDEVLFIPAGEPPHKEGRGILSAAMRLDMLKLALTESPQFAVCELELQRQGPSYTIDTVETLQEQQPDQRFFFIVGMDAFSEIATWKNPKLFLRCCDFAIISRPGSPFAALPNFDLLKDVSRTALHELDSGQRALYTLKSTPDFALHFMQIPPMPISASDIRADFQAGVSSKNRLPRSVESYIISHKIYRGDYHS